MDVQPLHDRGQTVPSPSGRVVGFVNTQAECDAIIEALNAVGVPRKKITVLFGQEGLHILERSQGKFFMGDAESETVEFAIQELSNGHVSFAVDADDRDEASRIAAVITQNGGHTVSYFGPLVAERLTK
ncbi:MAG TPA: hypothetical protein VFE24_04990 [Pirellulales bacterium]|jgi:hypothetical protein|nr:hypothetical protein [Pirellulales bacterium]